MYVQQPEGAGDPDVFIPFTGSPPPPSFTQLMLDAQTGYVLRQTCTQSKAIEEVLFDGASLGSV